MLPGLTQIAEDRAVQLIDNFAHTSLRALYNKYQYGEYVDVSDWGEGYENYWDADAKEAIGNGGGGSTPDESGQIIANMFHNSDGHWDYLGDSKYPYIGIGVAYGGPRGWYVCTLQTRVNYG